MSTKTKKPTESQLASLPVWARDYLKHLSLERDAAVRDLQNAANNQTPSPYSYTTTVSLGEDLTGKPVTGPTQVKRFLHAYSFDVCHGGVLLHISLNEKEGHRAEDSIILRWCASNEDIVEDIAFVPSGHGEALLKSHKNMRKRS